MKKETKKKTKASSRGESQKNRECDYIVGIGASAGGLEALRELFTTLEPSGHISYVVVQHLAPQHRSRLVELIAHTTRLPVKEVTDGEIPLPDTIYITPPNHDLVIEENELKLKEPSFQIGPKPSIDIFFNSLAQSFGNCSVGIILSGTGSDGSQGIRAIRAAGGLTICQKVDTAKYDGMPKAAKLTGAIDLELSTDRMAAELMNLSKRKQSIENIHNSIALELNLKSLNPYSKVLEVLAEETGVSFSDYKSSTIERRIERRVVANRLESLKEYAEYISMNRGEAKNLYQDVLISVTEFFRDHAAFDTLKAHLKHKLSTLQKGKNIRVWSIGCATGEEAYSLAIIYQECLEELKLHANVQIFATDLDENALSIARKGVYPKTSFAGVPTTILNKYFTPLDESFQIKSSIRETIIFSRHDIIKDPPFHSIDLISCRNLLIYFNDVLQGKVFKTIHYSLNHHGILFLGKSEATPGTEEFSVLDNTAKIFTTIGRKKTVPLAVSNIESNRESFIVKQELSKSNDIGIDLFHAMIKGLAPDSVVVDDEFKVKHVYGKAGTYLKLGPGEVSYHITKIVPPDTSTELTALLYRSQKTNSSVEGRHHEMVVNRSKKSVQFKVIPLATPEKRNFLVVFNISPVEKIDPKTKKASTAVTQAKYQKLERELNITREHLQSLIEEQETSNEEMQSLNEELQSANEELQSSNEELETTNEELQSTNEELTTLNQELNVKSTELLALNQRLSAIQNAIVYPLIILDKHKHLTDYNPAAKLLLKINENDLGVNFKAIPSLVDLSPVYQKLDESLEEENDIQFQLVHKERSFEIQIQLIRDSFSKIEGTVISFVENSEIIKSLDESRLMRQRLSDILENTPAAVSMKDLSGVYIYANRQFSHLVGLEIDNILGKTADEILGSSFGDKMRDLDFEVIKRKRALQFDENWEINGKEHNWTSSRFPLFDIQGRVQSLCTISLDITQRVADEKNLTLFKEAITSANIGILIFQSDGNGYRTNFASPYLEEQLEKPVKMRTQLKEFLGQLNIKDKEVSEIYEEIIQQSFTNFLLNTQLGQNQDSWIELRSCKLDIEESSPSYIIMTIFDVTQRIINQRTILQQQDELARFSRYATVGEIAAGIGHEINTPLNTITAKTDFLRKLVELNHLEKDKVLRVAYDIDHIAKNISSIVQGLKNLAKGDADISAYLDINDIIKDALKICEFRLHRFGAKLEFSPTPRSVFINCSSVQITQVIINLINNSIEAISQLDERWIKVEVKEIEDKVKITIQDSGTGIDPNLFEKIMTPFFTTKEKGTGIGLSLSRAIARKHNGDLILESKTNFTTFSLILPKNCFPVEEDSNVSE